MAERKRIRFDPLPDVGNATVGSSVGRFCTAGAPSGARHFSTLRQKGCVWTRTTSGAPAESGSGPRGSALGPGRKNSDGKPCSGVRGGQGASTDFPQRAEMPANLAQQGENAVLHAVFSLQILMDQRRTFL